ncbi:MAG: tRNA 2-thiocytidine(32) synthetase TtcA, partial [Desulfobulbaceae bacterium]|nr:tRNA 2-thiocytidine(32) synthetase TtcA [Desulfobulbaceae bacterium]
MTDPHPEESTAKPPSVILDKTINRLVGRAMHDYQMLADGDRVLLAVSGGIDSLVMSWLLNHWQRKAPISYTLLAANLDMGFGDDEPRLMEEQFQILGIPYLIERTDYGVQAMKEENGKSGCFHCAKKRRNRLFELAKEKGCNKVALGHHKEDIIETLFLNMFYSGNLSTMVPRQELFGGKLSLIRPLAYLEKDHIRSLGAEIGVTPVPNPCPLSEESKRGTVRTLLNDLYQQDDRLKNNIFAALGNIKHDYLLKPSTPKS